MFAYHHTLTEGTTTTMKTFLVALFSLSVLSTEISASPVGPTVVDVQLRNIETRSASTFGVRVQGGGKRYDLILQKPASSIFSPEFVVTTGQSDGSLTTFETTPTADILYGVEDNIYVDQVSDAVLNVVHTNDGRIQLRGVIDGFIINPKEGHHEMSPQAYADNVISDYVDTHRKVTPVNTRAIVNAQAELWVIMDYDNSQKLGQDRNRIVDYLALFYHAVNNRFATFQEPSISFLISGVTIMASRPAQPFLENNKNPDGSGNDIVAVADDFAKWVFANQNTGPKFDLATLVTGVDLQGRDVYSNGVFWSKNLAGRAFLRGACWKTTPTTTDRTLAVAIFEDSDNLFFGVNTAAHELAHSLGASHDGENESAGCSPNDGFIMTGYGNGWGSTNKLRFSTCSINAMKGFVTSVEGACLMSRQSPINIPVAIDNVGDRYTMTAQCIRYTGSTSGIPEPTKTPDELCRRLTCRYPTPGKPLAEGWYSITEYGAPAGDNTPCGIGNNGRCVNGYCAAVSG